jgi:hypothetical protein
MVIGTAAVMYCVEFFADKLPGVETGWDAIHTFIRIPGGTLAAGAHATKAGSRTLINTSPEPVTNWAASIGEDVLVSGGLWAALHYPWLFLASLCPPHPDPIGCMSSNRLFCPCIPRFSMHRQRGSGHAATRHSRAILGLLAPRLVLSERPLPTLLNP